MTTRTPSALQRLRRTGSRGQWMAEELGPPRRLRHYVENLSNLAYNPHSGDWFPVGHRAVCGAIAMQSDAAYMAAFPECPQCLSFVDATQQGSAA